MPELPIAIVDIETKSEVDLATVGAYRYAEDPSTDVLCLTIRTGETDSLELFAPFPWSRVANLLWGRRIQAFNDTFDFLIWNHILTPRYFWPAPESFEWEDLMARAAYANLPAALDDLAPVLGTPEKDVEGHKLMMRLCKPARATLQSNDPWRLHTPEALSHLAAYCKQDGIAEWALDAKLPKLPEHEIPVQRADRAMNQRGIRVDLNRVRRMQRMATMQSEALTDTLRAITRDQVASHTQLPALAAWLTRNGLPVRNGPGALDRYAIDGFLDGEYYGQPLEQPLNDDVISVLKIRRMLGKSSLAKLDKLEQATCSDGRVRGMFQYLGAKSTKRWAGRIIQPQNLPKGLLKKHGYTTALQCIDSGNLLMLQFLWGEEVMDVLSSCLRTCLVASEDKHLAVVDYNAIECRVAAWFASETWLLDCFAQGRDPYRITAGNVLGKPPEQVTAQERNDSGKLPELSCQYGLGWRSLKKQAKQKKLVLSDAQAKHIVDTYRETHPHIKRRWYELEDAATMAIRNAGTAYGVGPIAFRSTGTVLKMRLPSGNCIWFNRPAIEMLPAPWDPDEMKQTITYWGEDSITGRYSKQTAWGGDFMAYACQSMARDLIAHSLVELEREFLSPVLTVHDEIGCDTHWPFAAVEDVMVNRKPAWAVTLPIKAEGFESSFYKK